MQSRAHRLLLAWRKRLLALLEAALVVVAVICLAGGTALADGTGPYFQLQQVTPDKPYKPYSDVSDGHVGIDDPGYAGDYTWSEPPATMDMSGFTITLNVKAVGKSGSFATGIGMGSDDGFTFDPTSATRQVNAPANGTDSDNVTIKVTPPDTADGSTVSFKIAPFWGIGVTYTYVASNNPVQGNGSSSQSPTPTQLAVSIDCPDSITISAPDLNCHLIIGGFRHNTADPIEVILPQATDTFGNHPNGIQLDQLAGEQDVYNMDDPYSWGFFAFACPSAPNVGHNCYQNVAVAGSPATVPIIVRQGEDSVTVALTFNVLAAPISNPPGPPGPTPNPGPGPKPQGPRGPLSSEPGLNRPGGDYANFTMPNADPRICQSSCATDNRCQAYTYVIPTNGQPAQCWLKLTIPAAVPSPCCVSGIRVQPPPAGSALTLEPGTDRSGMDYSGYDLPQADPAMCQADCAADGRCVAYTYVRPQVQGPNARCWLKSGVPAAALNDCCVSGVRQ